MEVGDVARNIGEGVVDLVVDDQRLGAEVGHGQPRPPSERHFPIAVEAAAGVHAHGQGADLGEFLPAVGEEVAGGTFDGGLLLVVPVGAQDGVAPLTPRQGHPYLLDGAGAFDVRQVEGVARLDDHVGRDLPALPQVPRRVGGRAVRGHAAGALFAGEVFRTDGPRPGLRQPGQVSQVQTQARKSAHRDASRCGRHVSDAVWPESSLRAGLLQVRRPSQPGGWAKAHARAAGGRISPPRALAAGCRPADQEGHGPGGVPPRAARRKSSRPEDWSRRSCRSGGPLPDRS